MKNRDILKRRDYAETMAYCDRLDAASDWVTVKSFGKSAQGRALPLVIIDKQGFTTPDQIRSSGRIILLVQACIHAGRVRRERCHADVDPGYGHK